MSGIPAGQLREVIALVAGGTDWRGLARGAFPAAPLLRRASGGKVETELELDQLDTQHRDAWSWARWQASAGGGRRCCRNRVRFPAGLRMTCARALAYRPPPRPTTTPSHDGVPQGPGVFLRARLRGAS
jgi:hypothetical protein